MSALLEVDNVSKSFGGVQANKAISLAVPAGAIVGLIGPNGSGKTTLFSSIVGQYLIDQGSIRFEGQEISKLRVPQIARLGLLRTFQQTRIYGQMTCMQNMIISASVRKRGFGELFHGQHDPAVSRHAEDMLEFVGLYEKRLLQAGSLSFPAEAARIRHGADERAAAADAGRAHRRHQSDADQRLDRPAQARQRPVRHHVVRDRAQYARDHESRPAHLLPGPRRAAGLGPAGQDPQRSQCRRRLFGDALK
jgi:ABC-type sugar transport system ATPase subunit